MKESSPERNVLIAIDVQNDFIDGSLAVARGSDVIAPINQLARATRSTENGTVVFTRDYHPPITPHFETWPVHCVQNTRGSDFHPALEINRRDVILSKGMGQEDGYSGMEGMGPRGKTLERLVQPRGSEKVRAFMAGLATDYCVKATALDMARRFGREPRVELYLVRDAVRAVNRDLRDERNALRAMEHAGIIALTSREIQQTFFGKQS